MLTLIITSTSESLNTAVDHTPVSRLFLAFDVQVSRDEEELAKKRLEVKRGLPLQVCLLFALNRCDSSGGSHESTHCVVTDGSAQHFNLDNTMCHSAECHAHVQDLKGNRGFPEDPRLAANQKLQAEVILHLLSGCHSVLGLSCRVLRSSMQPHQAAFLYSVTPYTHIPTCKSVHTHNVMLCRASCWMSRLLVHARQD